MLKSGIYGKYNGIEYEITIDMDNNIKIMTEEINDIDHAFVNIYNSGVYSKKVNRSELTDCVSVSYFGNVDGERVQILQETEDEFQISSGSMLVGDNLNIPRIDRETWLGWVPKRKVKLIEEKNLIDPQVL
ncbi:hypothetical protein ACQKNS_26775 [Peribacillus sp. NPDC094092]|uniref:hypothetical protein n=1 Tax=Peribacillus sp. NPDC094092 TaxID=3390611 RepID=UPI003D008979